MHDIIYEVHRGPSTGGSIKGRLFSECAALSHPVDFRPTIKWSEKNPKQPAGPELLCDDLMSVEVKAACCVRSLQRPTHFAFRHLWGRHIFSLAELEQLESLLASMPLVKLLRHSKFALGDLLAILFFLFAAYQTRYRVSGITMLPLCCN